MNIAVEMKHTVVFLFKVNGKNFRRNEASARFYKTADNADNTVFIRIGDSVPCMNRRRKKSDRNEYSDQT